MNLRKLSPLLLLLSLQSLRADDALLDALVEKGVISHQEAEKIKEKSQSELQTSTSDQIIHIGDAVKRLTFYGDIRLRAEMRDGSYGPGEVNGNMPAPTAPTAAALKANPGAAYTTGGGTALYNSGGSETRDRLRYRVRLGFNGELYDNFYFGVGMTESTTSSRGNNVTLGTSDSAGPFGKGQAIIAINRVFLGWRPTDYLNFQVGQFENPIYNTSLTWDSNLNPQGFAEGFTQDYGNLNVFANAGQFIYGATSFANTSSTSGLNYTDIYLLDEQLGLKYKFTKDIEFKGAIGISTYTGTRTSTANNPGTETQVGSYATSPLAENPTSTGGGAQPNDFAGPFTGAAPDPYMNNYAINNLMILDIPAELKFKLGKVPMRLFGDFAMNLNAQARSDAAANAIANGSGVATGATSAATLNAAGSGGVPSTYSQAQQLAILSSPEAKNLDRNNANQDMAYEAGLQVGELKDRHDWMAKAFWLDRQYYSVDPNLTDVDLFDGRVNMQGYVLQGNYNITKGLTGTVTYAEASRSDKQLATPGVGQDLTLGSIDHYRIVQLDLLLKF